MLLSPFLTLTVLKILPSIGEQRLFYRIVFYDKVLEITNRENVLFKIYYYQRSKMIQSQFLEFATSIRSLEELL